MTPEEGEEFSPLLHQVAGCHSGVLSDILVNRNGQILKPYKVISNPTFREGVPESSTNGSETDLIPVTLNELQFYKTLHQSTESDFAELKTLAPLYFGSIYIRGIDHLILEDFTKGMKYPCVMDIKIGRDRYYPGRTPEKAKQDNIKYPSLREFGFCLAGIKLWNGKTGEVEMHLVPKVTRGFSSDEVKEHIKKFLRVDDAEANSAIRTKILEDSKAVLSWCSNQRTFILRGSSLLFIYDAAGLYTNAESDEEQIFHNARVGMIDFAHVFHSFGKRDENYMNGLKNLVDFLLTCHLI